MKKIFRTFLPLLLLLILIFTNSCNKEKVSESAIENGKNEILKHKLIQEKKAITIDTVDYNKRMLALANSDTTGRWPVKKFPIRCQERYCLITESLLIMEIYILKEWGFLANYQRMKCLKNYNWK